MIPIRRAIDKSEKKCGLDEGKNPVNGDAIVDSSGKNLGTVVKVKNDLAITTDDSEYDVELLRYDKKQDAYVFEESVDESGINTADVYPQAGPELRNFITSFSGSDHKSDIDDLRSDEEGEVTDLDLVDAATPPKTDSLIKPDTEVIEDPNAVQNQANQDTGVTSSDLSIPFVLSQGEQ